MNASIDRSMNFVEKHYTLFSAIALLHVAFYYSFCSIFISSLEAGQYLFPTMILSSLTLFNLTGVYKKIISTQYNGSIYWSALFFNLSIKPNKGYKFRVMATAFLELVILFSYYFGFDIGGYLFGHIDNEIEYFLSWIGYSFMIDLVISMFSAHFVLKLNSFQHDVVKHSIAVMMISTFVITITFSSSIVIFALALIMLFVYIFLVSILMPFVKTKSISA